MRALLVGLSLMAGCSSQNDFDGSPKSGVVGKVTSDGYWQTPWSDVAVTVYTPAPLSPIDTTRSDASGDFDFDVPAGTYLLCAAVGGCPADSQTSSCCTSADAPVGDSIYVWVSDVQGSGGAWQHEVP